MKTYEQFVKENLKAAIAGAVVYHAIDLARLKIKRTLQARRQERNKNKAVSRPNK